VARKDLPPRDILLHPELVVRESCGSAAGSAASLQPPASSS
jgi:hypothetical protein